MRKNNMARFSSEICDVKTVGVLLKSLIVEVNNIVVNNCKKNSSYKEIFGRVTLICTKQTLANTLKIERR